MIYDKAPFPWFGGKRDAAPSVWAALGDVDHYVEPFMGSLAVLIQRPHLANRTYHTETVNDLDGLLVNAWRAIRSAPDAVAEAASWPVSEVDLMARHLALVRWKDECLGRMRADPDFCDPKMAGWWVWGQSCWIGGDWCSGTGPWTVSPLGGVVKQSSKTRADREPGVSSRLIHMPCDRGILRQQAREPGVQSQLPYLSGDGKGINRSQARDPGVGDFHPMTMPEIRRWLDYLSARLRHVRIAQGSWERLVTSAALQTLEVRNDGVCGIFLDPPYGDVRAANVYASDSLTVAGDVQKWCIENGGNPRYRVVLAGFDTEHVVLQSHGWRVVEWFRGGFLKGGMANIGSAGTNQHRERLWLSPHCLGADERQASLFGGTP